MNSGWASFTKVDTELKITILMGKGEMDLPQVVQRHFQAGAFLNPSFFSEKCRLMLLM